MVMDSLMGLIYYLYHILSAVVWILFYASVARVINSISEEIHIGSDVYVLFITSFKLLKKVDK